MKTIKICQIHLLGQEGIVWGKVAPRAPSQLRARREDQFSNFLDSESPTFGTHWLPDCWKCIVFSMDFKLLSWVVPLDPSVIDDTNAGSEDIGLPRKIRNHRCNKSLKCYPLILPCTRCNRLSLPNVTTVGCTPTTYIHHNVYLYDTLVAFI